MLIGGKTKKAHKPEKPQFVVKRADNMNEFMLLRHNPQGELSIFWTGDPNTATKFDSKYSAKTRIRDFDNIPASRIFMELE